MILTTHKGTLRRCDVCNVYSLHPERCKCRLTNGPRKAIQDTQNESEMSDDHEDIPKAH